MHFRNVSAIIAAAASLWAGLSAAGPARAEWLKAESPGFVVYSEGSEVHLRKYVEDLERFDGLLRFLHGLEREGQPRKLPIYLVSGPGEIRRTLPGAGSGLGGFYSAGPRDVFAVATRDRSDDYILLHEYVHHFMFANAPYGYPAWLVEGYAEYFMTADVQEAWVEVGRFHEGRATNLLALKWIPLERVLRDPPSAFRTPEQREAYYGQAWLLTHYLMSDPERHKQMVRYMRAVGEQGADPVAALQEATGTSPAGLERRLHNYLRGGLKYRKYSLKTDKPSVRVAKLSAAADGLLLDQLALKRSLDAREGAAVLARVRAQAGRHRGDPLAEQTLALAEVEVGDRAAGEAILQKLAAADPNNAELLELLGHSRLEAAEAAPGQRAALHKEATRHLAQAYRADPARYQTLISLARARSIAPDYPTDNDLETLMAALEMAPQVNSLRLRTAQAMALRGRHAWVVTLLPPLASNPHGGGEAEVARALLEEARRKAGGAAKPATAAR